jgi:hypothetical protein
MVQVTISGLASAFLLLPKGPGFLEYADFRDAYEVLKQRTGNFAAFTPESVMAALHENSRAFVVLRSILGMTPPEWADLARTETGNAGDQGSARSLDKSCRADPTYIADVERRFAERAARQIKAGKPPLTRPLMLDRIQSLVSVAVGHISQGAPQDVDGVIHRLAKLDTRYGFDSVRYAANEGVTYADLLYERYLGRPFAGHRDAVSELVGEVMENAVEQQLRGAGISYRKTKRAERIPGFGQAPDFCIPDERTPAVVIEAKITSDDGTARDKVTRIKALANQRDGHVTERGFPPYEVVACIDGRGFRQRREDMRQLLLALDGKVFTTVTLDRLIAHTALRRFVSTPEVAQA